LKKRNLKKASCKEDIEKGKEKEEVELKEVKEPKKPTPQTSKTVGASGGVKEEGRGDCCRRSTRNQL
jgi:hypothetical protein